MEYEKVLRLIQEADMILIGLGEEFDEKKVLKQDDFYNTCKDKLENRDKEWLLPALNMIAGEEKGDIAEILGRFADLISNKNYFVVSVSTNEHIRQAPWREGRLVMPCGGSGMKQCPQGCIAGLTETTDDDWTKIRTYLASLESLGDGEETPEFEIGVCPECGMPLVLNNIYMEKYDENGYLDQWKLYTKWLQGTLNRKLLVLELGVGMQCPSVIRWPFEKVAYFNQKASFYRVNETLYQLSEELKEKGMSISQNAIDWLRVLC